MTKSKSKTTGIRNKEGLRQCRVCKIFKPDSEFYYAKRDHRCKECERKRTKKYLLEHPRKKRGYTIKPIADDLDISTKELLNIYDILLEQQDGCCAVCGIHISEIDRSFDIDHCHKTKIVRGLLCNNCNVAIGRLKDSPELCYKAAEYLDR